MKKIILPIAIAACALAAQFAPAAPPPDVKEIMSKPFTDIPGKEGLVLTVTCNASDSKPAKFVVFLVKKQGVPALLPAK